MQKNQLSSLEIEAMRLVHRHPETFGRLRFAEVLAGRSSGAVREHRLDDDPAFGKAADRVQALAVLDALLARGLLRVAGPNPRRPLLALGPRAATPRVTADNPRGAPLERFSAIHLAQLRRLIRWRDLIAFQECLRPGRVGSSRALRTLLRSPPASMEALVATGLIPPGAPTRFRNAVLAVLQGHLADPTPAEMAQSLAARATTPRVPITRQILAWARPPHGRFTRAQIELLELPWPPPRDWKARALTRSLTSANLRRFLDPCAP